MSRLLSELLGASEPMFASSVDQLERASGQQSIDVRLGADIVAATHRKMRALGLDPKDTSGPELYQALIDLVRLHDEFLVKAIGGHDPSDVNDLLPRIVSVAQKIRLPRQVWALKHASARRLLQAHPPRRALKALGYRSLDSLLKREPIGIIFAAMRVVESPQWCQQFMQQYQRLSPSDFESRPVEIFYVNTPRWAKAVEPFVRGQHHNIAHSKEMGAILVLPLPVATLPGITITALPLLLHYINELRMYSAFFKLQQVKSHFGKIIAETIQHDPKSHVRIAGQGLHWRVIHQHFGRQSPQSHPELFEPHLQHEDLEWRQAEDVLFHLEPALQFWHDSDYMGVVKDGKVISFNLIDAATNYINQLPFERQVHYHQQASLWNELFLRYMGEPALEAHIMKQLDDDLLDVELAFIRT